jgi:hypothetical protein
MEVLNELARVTFSFFAEISGSGGTCEKDITQLPQE